VTNNSAVAAAHELRALFSRLRRRLQELSGDQDLTPSQAAALIRLFKQGPMSTSELAGAERVRPQSMATVVAVLDERGLITRSADPGDGRRQLLTLTTDGRRRAHSDRHQRQEWLVNAFTESYTESERQVILRALGLLGRLTDE